MAKKEGKDTFEYQGKTYNVKESIKKYTFSVEEDDPDSAEKKKDDNSVIDNTKNSKAKAEEDSVDEDAEEGNISPETVNAVIKLLNKRKLENKKAKTEEDEKEEDDDKDKKSSGKSTVADMSPFRRLARKERQPTATVEDPKTKQEEGQEEHQRNQEYRQIPERVHLTRALAPLIRRHGEPIGQLVFR